MMVEGMCETGKNKLRTSILELSEILCSLTSKRSALVPLAPTSHDLPPHDIDLQPHRTRELRPRTHTQNQFMCEAIG